jgi:ankyrin repeat protein
MESHSEQPINSLEQAIEFGDLNQIDYFITHGMDLNAPNIYGITPLHQASEVGNELVVNKLLLAGVSPNLYFGPPPPIYLATMKGHIKVVECLIKAGANMNFQHEDGLTPLMEASGAGYFELVRLLVEAGADPNIFDDHDCKAITYAGLNGYIEIINYLGGFASKEELEESIFEATEGKGAKVRKKRENRFNKLLDAVKTNNIMELELVLKLGVNLHSKDDKGKTALNYAIENNSTEVIELLRNFGAKSSIG